MKKLLLLSALLIFACSSELFCQDYMKMNKKNLRIEYQKKLNQIDSLKQVLDLTYSKNQNLQSNLNSANNDLLSISDSLKNSNLEISQLEAKLLNSKNELSQLGLEIDNLVKQNSGYLGLITDKNLQIDSLRTSLNIASDEKSDLISQNSLKTRTIDSLIDQNEVLIEQLNEPSLIIGELKRVYEDEVGGYEDNIESTCFINNIIIKTVWVDIEHCAESADCWDSYYESSYYKAGDNVIAKKKDLKSLFKNPEIVLKLINKNFKEYFYELYKDHKDCMDYDPNYKYRSWSSIKLHVGYQGGRNRIWFESNLELNERYCERMIGNLTFDTSFNEILKLIKQ